MDSAAARAALDALIQERREDYAGLSRLLGRNPAYIQQHVKRGSPRRLSEHDRATLARYLGVDEAALGAPARGAAPAMIAVPRLALGASAGPGALVEDDAAAATLAFPPAVLRELGVAPGAALSMIRVAGDSMAPTLLDGDDILVDRDAAAAPRRDGIHVVRLDGALLVKRLAWKPGGGLAIRSDNPDHRSWEDVDPALVDLVGRVVWAGRRLR